MITALQFNEMLERTSRRQVEKGKPDPAAVPLEMPLHQSIMDYCNSQWPRWKYIRARSDCESTIEAGACDFTIFLPGAKAICIECKAKGRKQSPKQRDWAKEMQMLGWNVAVVYSFGAFLDEVDKVLMPQFREAIK